MEKLFVVVLVLYWIVIFVLIFVVMLLIDSVVFLYLLGYLFLLMVYVYGLDVIWFLCIGVGMLYFCLWFGLNW